MKKLLLIFVVFCFIAILSADTTGATYNILNQTGTQVITFPFYSLSYPLNSVRVECYWTVTGGSIAADNDDDVNPATVTLTLGGTFDLVDTPGNPILLDDSAFPGVDSWGSTVQDLFSAGLTANVGDEGGAGHPIFDASPTDGVQYSGTNPTDMDYHDVNAAWTSTYIGTGNFTWNLDITAINNVSSVGGNVDGAFSAVDFGGQVRIIYDYTVPVTLSSFTANYFDGSPILQWTTQSETNNIGWNVYRADSEEYEYSMQINNELIPGAGTTSQPTDYIFSDEYTVYPNLNYWYWIEDISSDGNTNVHGPISLTVPEEGYDPESPEIYNEARLYNIPNPFNPITTIMFDIEGNVSGEVLIYDIKGNLVRKLHDGPVPQSGITWDSRDELGKKVPSGIYLYVLKTDQKTYAKKMVLAK